MGSRGTILIVDDDDDTRSCVITVLESEGYTVDVARDGREALDALGKGGRPDLVLLDLMMPVMSGWDVLDEIARMPGLTSVPIVVFTAAGAPTTREAQLRRPVLRKPIDLDLLLAMVERFCAAGWQAEEAPSDLMPKLSG